MIFQYVSIFLMYIDKFKIQNVHVLNFRLGVKNTAIDNTI